MHELGVASELLNSMLSLYKVSVYSICMCMIISAWNALHGLGTRLYRPSDFMCIIIIVTYST